MPRYEYRCETNGKTVEVSHPMAASPKTWGEVCALGELAPGVTPRDAPVEKVLSLSFVGGSTGGPPPAGPCGSACGCFPN